MLALLQRESGFERVEAAMVSGAMASAVNVAEVLSSLALRKLSPRVLLATLESAGLEIVPFGEQDAALAAELHPSTRALGLSLADRACVVLGKRLGATVMTTDRAWSAIRGVQIEFLR